MADPQAALATQLRNIEARTGATLAQLRSAISDSGLTKHGEVRAMLMQRYSLGYGDANTLAHRAKAEPAQAAAEDPLDAMVRTVEEALGEVQAQDARRVLHLVQ